MNMNINILVIFIAIIIIFIIIIKLTSSPKSTLFDKIMKLFDVKSKDKSVESFAEDTVTVGYNTEIIKKYEDLPSFMPVIISLLVGKLDVNLIEKRCKDKGINMTLEEYGKSFTNAQPGVAFRHLAYLNSIYLQFYFIDDSIYDFIALLHLELLIESLRQIYFNQTQGDKTLNYINFYMNNDDINSDYIEIIKQTNLNKSTPNKSVYTYKELLNADCNSGQTCELAYKKEIFVIMGKDLAPYKNNFKALAEIFVIYGMVKRYHEINPSQSGSSTTNNMSDNENNTFRVEIQKYLNQINTEVGLAHINDVVNNKIININDLLSIDTSFNSLLNLV